MAYETPLTIFEVVQDISANKYILPSIQREFTWSTSQIEQLFDSLMQEYPIMVPAIQTTSSKTIVNMV